MLVRCGGFLHILATSKNRTTSYVRHLGFESTWNEKKPGRQAIARHLGSEAYTRQQNKIKNLQVA